MYSNPSPCYRLFVSLFFIFLFFIFIFYVNCCDFFCTKDFVGRLGIMLLNSTRLRSPDIFYYNHASRSQKGKISRWNKHAGQQADLASQFSECSLPANKCEQMKNRGTNCAFILVAVRSAIAQSSFHTEFLISIRFSLLLFLRRRKRTRNFLAFSPGH